MKIGNLRKVKREKGHRGTVSSWNLFTEDDFWSDVPFFNDNLVEPGVIPGKVANLAQGEMTWQR